MAKKTDVSTGSADTSGLRRSGRETPTKKPTPSSHLSSRKSPRIEKQTPPVPSPLKDKVEKQVGSSPLRRSDRGKKSVEIPDLPNIKSTKEKTPNNSKQSPEDVKTESEDVDGGMKRKRMTAIRYKALFKPQRLIIPSDDDEGPEVEAESPQADTSKNKDVDKVPKSQDGVGDQEAPDKDHNMFLEEKVIDLEDIEDGDCPRAKSPDGKSNENSDNHVVPTSSDRIEHDLENQNQQVLDAPHKVTESNDVCGNMRNSKFVEFWVPIQISNVQLEQYCATLLSKEMNLCSSLKGDPHGALEEVFTTIRMCCNHPFIVDRSLETTLHQGFKDTRSKEGELSLLDVGIKASGKLQFLDLVLPKLREHQLKVLILFHFMSGSLPLGEILANYVTQRFGENSFERLEGVGMIASKKQAPINTFNEDKSRFIFLLESRACHPSIRFSSVDVIIIFDSDINPSNDLKSLQKFSIESQSEQIMIFRLYSSSTLEEKNFQYAENNHDGLLIRSQNSRSSYDTLLTWGASDLFGKLAMFHRQPGRNISSGDSLQKDAVDEFLYIISHKCKSKKPTSKAIIQARNWGNHGKNSEVKTHLPNEDQAQAYLFWRKLLNGRSPDWKFVSKLTPRQRKRPSYFLDSSGEKGGEDSGGARTRRRTVNNSSTVEPAQVKTITGGVNEANNESLSPSGDRFWSTTVNSELSLLDQLKPTVSDLCNILKFSENVKDLVERFLEFVLDNYQVSKEHTSALHAFMISLCWIGSSLAKDEIDRSESFALAKKHFDFSCTEEEANTVYIKLEEVKEPFLKSQSQHVPAPEGVKLVPKKSKEIPNSKKSNETVSMKGNEVYEKLKREWDQKRADMVNEYEMEKALILSIFRKPSLQRFEQLKVIERAFAKDLEDHDRLRSLFEDFKKTADGQVSAHPEVAPTSRESPTEPQGRDEPVCEVGNDIESTGSHTSEKEMVGATVLGEQIGEVREVPAQEVGDDVDADMAEKEDLVEAGVPEVDLSHQNAEGGTICPVVSHAVEDHNETGANDMASRVNSSDVYVDVAEKVDLVEKGIPENVYSNENAEGGTADVSCAFEDRNVTAANDMAPHVDSSDMDVDVAEKVDLVENGIRENDSTNENAKGGTADVSRAFEDHNETGANDTVPHLDSCGMEMPDGNDKENTADGTIDLDTSHAVKDRHETVLDDVAPEAESAEMATSAGTCNKESPEEGEIYPDTPDADDDHNETSQNEVTPRVESAEAATPADNDVLHAIEAHNDTRVPDDGNPGCAAISQDKTPSVQPVSSLPLDHSEPIIPEIQSEQLPNNGIQDEEINVGDPQPSDASQPDQVIILDGNFGNMQLSDASQPDQIIPDVNAGNLQPQDASQLDPIIPYNGPDIPPSTDPMVVENPSVTLSPNGPLLEPTREASRPRENLEENLAAPADPINEEQQPDLVTTVAPTPPVNLVNMFDNLVNQVNPLMLNHDDPLQAEVERLCIVKENVTKLHQDVKQKLNDACEKEIAEIVARIKAKYEAKHQQTDEAYNSKKMELERSINRVTMNKFLAEAFRSKCQDLTPSGHPGRQQVMQQLHRHVHGQPSGNQQPPQLPMSQPQPRQRAPPPLQIVHQPAALFSSPLSRPAPTVTNIRPPSTVSTTPTRPPSSSSPSTPIRPSLVVNQTTPSTIVTTSRQSPGSNVATPSPLLNRASPSITQIDMSAANQRINTETRCQNPHVRPPVGSEPRAPARHLRPLISNEPRAPSPQIRPLVSNSPRAPPPHMRPLVNNEPRAPPPHLIRSFRSPQSSVGSHQRSSPSQNATIGPSHQPVILPVPTSSPQSILPRPLPPSEPYLIPPSPPSTQTPVVVVPASDNSNGPADNASRRVNIRPQPIDSEYILNSSSAHELVCLSDDD